MDTSVQASMDLQPDEDFTVPAQPPLGPIHVKISKSFILAEAIALLGFNIKETVVLDMGPHGMVAKITIDMPLHRGWVGLNAKHFCGEFQQDPPTAIESASLVAINYLQENNLVVVDDANFQPLSVCKRQLLEASSWASAFEMRTKQLAKQVAEQHGNIIKVEENTPLPQNYVNEVHAEKSTTKHDTHSFSNHRQGRARKALFTQTGTSLPIHQGLKMDAVRIAETTILAAMLHTLRLPKPLYHTEPAQRTTMKTTIEFYVAFPTKAERRSMIHDNRTPVEEIKNLLARQALEFMELTCNKTPSDYNYPKLKSFETKFQQAQKTNMSLHQQIAEQAKVIQCLTKSLYASVDAGYKANIDLQHIVDINFSPGSDKTDYQMNHTMLDVQAVATYLDESTVISDDILPQTKPGPCCISDAENSNELGAFTNDDFNDDLQSNSRCSYDSDGRHYLDEY